MKRLQSIYFLVVMMAAAILISCGSGTGESKTDEAFLKQLAEDAKAYTEMKCELMAQLKAVKADTTLINQEQVSDSLKALWKEQATPLQEKYSDSEHKDLFKEKVKEYQAEIPGCEGIGEGKKVK